ARFEEAFKQATAMQQDAINSGNPVPVAVTAAREMGLDATNLRAVQALRVTREERYLLTMMQVERSHVPFPDEPPIQFPPARTWKELTDLRKDRYLSSGLGPEIRRRTIALAKKLEQPIDLEKGIDKDTPLKDALEFLSDRYDLTILIDTEAFKQDLMVM